MLGMVVFKGGNCLCSQEFDRVIFRYLFCISSPTIVRIRHVSQNIPSMMIMISAFKPKSPDLRCKVQAEGHTSRFSAKPESRLTDLTPSPHSGPVNLFFAGSELSARYMPGSGEAITWELLPAA